MTVLVLIATALAVMVGAVAQSATGVGFGLIAAPALLLAAPAAGPLPVLTASLVVLSITLADNRSGWRPRPVALMVAGSVPGVIIGALLLPRLDAMITSFVVGIVIVLAGGATLAGACLPSGPRALVIAGAAAGVLNSLASVPGPALALVHRPPSAAEFRATLSAAFLGMTVLSLAATAITTQPNGDVLLLCAGVTVVAVAGQLIGRRWVRGLPVGGIRTGAVVLSILAGLVLMVSAFLDAVR